jgi:hypothetical protein
MPEGQGPDAAEAQTCIGWRLCRAREAVGVPGRVWVPYARETIKTARKAGAKSPLTREAELELLKHFGAGGNAGRAAELSARGSEAITASPAS